MKQHREHWLLLSNLGAFYRTPIGLLKSHVHTIYRRELCAFGKRTSATFQEPETTPSVLATIPDCLRGLLQDAMEGPPKQRKSILVSSNGLANRFILERWGIRPSQRRRYRNLYASVRKQTRSLLQHYLLRERIEWTLAGDTRTLGVFKFDEIRGNLIVGFVCVSAVIF